MAGRWQDEYLIGERVQVLLALAEPGQFQWFTGRVIRKTNSGFPVVEIPPNAFVWYCNRKGEIRPLADASGGN